LLLKNFIIKFKKKGDDMAVEFEELINRDSNEGNGVIFGEISDQIPD